MDSLDKSIQVRYRKRDSGAIITEFVLMEAGLRYLYENPLGLQIFNLVLNHAFICWLHSKWQDTSISRKNIVKFACKYKIDLSEIELPIWQYSSFNAFFSRRLKVGSRNFNKSADILVSPADGKILVYPNLGENTLLPVKGSYCTIAQILNCETTEKLYKNGSALIIRLSPADYHRFHFIDNGIANKVREIKGKYHSVNPIALSAVPDIYCRNKRVITEFCTDNFGYITYVEIGAFCIGTIVQTFSTGKVYRGQEKGYFKYGGSTIILLFESGKIGFDEDLIADSADNLETQVKAGEQVGRYKKV